MRGHPDQIEQALSDLADAVSQDLVEQGWQRRDLNHGVATLTRDIGNGVMATATLTRTSFQWPEEWPIEVEVGFGVGYEPALNLMPLLTLDPDAALLDRDRDHDHDRPGFTVTLGGVADTASAARQIVAQVREHAIPYAQQFPDPAAIEAVLSAPSHPLLREPPAEADLDVDESFADYRTQRRLLLLAAMGRHDQARTLLSGYPAGRGDQPMDRDDGRFVRQLTRWLDAGGPAAPPVAETLALLPRSPQRPRPSWADTRARSKRKRGARDAVTSRITSESTAQEISALLAAEYARRDIEISPSQLAVAGQLIHEDHRLRQQPFGRVRSRLAGLRLLRAGAGDVVRAFKSDDTPPAWLRPPERAGYRMTRGNNPAAVVTLDPPAQDWLDRVWTEMPRAGFIVGVDVWLTEDDSAELVAHIGDRRVGTISAAGAGAFTRELHAAALFDEDPFAHGLLVRVQETGPLVLEIPTPA